jgi:hypothetical protein
MMNWYTNTNMVVDINSRNSTLRYLMTFAGEKFHGNQGRENMLRYPLQRLLVLLKRVNI